MAAIRRCFIASICYNSLAGTLAVTGVISPLMAAILMPVSSFTVFALAYAAAFAPLAKLGPLVQQGDWFYMAQQKKY